MKKTNIKRIAVTALLLFTVIALLIPVALAANDVTYSIEVNYNATQCGIKLWVDGRQMEPIASEQGKQTFTVPGSCGSMILEIVPTSNGYKVQSLQDEDGSYSGDNNRYDITQQAAKDTVFTVTCVENEFTIMEKDAVQGSHKWFDEEKRPNEKKYTYNSDTPVLLYTPTLSGYRLVGWDLLDENQNSVTKLLYVNTDEDYVTLPTNICPTIGKVLYAMPIWEGESQAVTRKDLEYGSSSPVNDDPTGSQTVWYAPTGTTGITGENGGNDADRDAGTLLDEGGYKLYPGYEPFFKYAEDSTGAYFDSLSIVKSDVASNVVRRYYTPIEYTLVYRGFEDISNVFDDYQATEGYKSTHIYNQENVIPQPKREGYDFMGWRVYVGETDITSKINSEVNIIKNLTLAKRQAYFAEGNTDRVIVLEATWAPQKFPVNVYFESAEQGSADMELEYVYDALLTVPMPYKLGYDFVGWTLIYNGTAKDFKIADEPTQFDEALQLLLGDDAEERYLDEVKLVAIWTPKVYKVELKDENGATLGDTVEVQATYDQEFLIDPIALPTLEGHTFLGFFSEDGRKWIDENGNATGLVWDIDANGAIALYARWQANTYNVTVSYDTEHATVVFTDAEGNEYPYTGEALPFLYGTVLNVKITVTDSDYKITKWNGQALPEHLRVLETTYKVGVENSVSALILRVIALPDFKVDYPNEIITTATGYIPNGIYQLSCGEVTLVIRVETGKITVDDGTSNKVVKEIKLHEAFFGNTVHMIVRGVDGASSDNEMTFDVPARREAPQHDEGNAWIDNITSSHNAIEVTLNPEKLFASDLTPDDFEFACLLASEDYANIVWLRLTANEAGVVRFIELEYGTDYKIYVRLRANDTQPHGKEFGPYVEQTEYTNYIKNQIAALEQQKTGGEMVGALLDQYIKEIEEIGRKGDSISDVEAQVEKIVQKALGDALTLAKEQDDSIRRLTEVFDELTASNGFDEIGKAAVTDAYTTTVKAIREILADTTLETLQDRLDAIQKLTGDTEKRMRAIEIVYVYDDDNRLSFVNGLPQGTKLDISADAYDRLIAMIEAAVADPNRVVRDGSEITNEELTSLVLKAYYQMQLSLPDGAVSKNGEYEILLLLPEDLRSQSGLQVAYYNEQTGILTVLRTERDGDYLRFFSPQSGVADFVILGDDEINLLVFIGALGLTILFQLIAIVVLSVRRVKYAKRVRTSYGFAIPTVVMLSVRFLPQNGTMILAIMGGLAVILQIVLMYLLLSSDMVFRQKEHREYRGTDAAGETASNAQATVIAQEGVSADGYADEPNENGAFQDAENVFAFVNDSDEPFAEAVATDADDETAYGASEEEAYGNEVYEEDSAYVYADEDGEARTDEEDPYGFIEPPVTPRYSLPEEGEMYIDPETGELYETFAEEDDGYEAVPEAETPAYEDGDGYGAAEGKMPAWQPEPEPDPEEEEIYDTDVLYEDEAVDEEERDETQSYDGYEE